MHLPMPRLLQKFRCLERCFEFFVTFYVVWLKYQDEGSYLRFRWLKKIKTVLKTPFSVETATSKFSELLMVNALSYKCFHDELWETKRRKNESAGTLPVPKQRGTKAPIAGEAPPEKGGDN